MSTESADAITVTAGLLVRNGCVLACQRRRGDAFALKWEFPGGKVEPGEDLAECLARELREELTIVADVGPELARVDHAYAGGPHVTVVFFGVRSFSGEPQNLAFEQLRWVEPPELATLDFLAADAGVVAELAAPSALHRRLFSMQDPGGELLAALEHGVELFNRQQFFEAHEVWERQWYEEVGAERQLLQGLIQVAAGFYKLQVGTLAGTVKLLAKGTDKLAGIAPERSFGVDLPVLLSSVDHWRRVAQERMAEGRTDFDAAALPRLGYRPPRGG